MAKTARITSKGSVVSDDRLSLSRFSSSAGIRALTGTEIGTGLNDNTVMRRARIYNAGGGRGDADLSYGTLREEQMQMYQRTLSNESTIQMYSNAQERRQIVDTEPSTTITVNVSREEFPEITCNITIHYAKRTFAELEWNGFIAQVQKKLGMEYIHSILERADKSPVARILSLRDKGEYLVRQQEVRGKRVKEEHNGNAVCCGSVTNRSSFELVFLFSPP